MSIIDKSIENQCKHPKFQTYTWFPGGTGWKINIKALEKNLFKAFYCKPKFS